MVLPPEVDGEENIRFTATAEESTYQKTSHQLWLLITVNNYFALLKEIGIVHQLIDH